MNVKVKRVAIFVIIIFYQQFQQPILYIREVYSCLKLLADLILRISRRFFQIVEESIK
jgi:hypothetical protein